MEDNKLELKFGMQIAKDTIARDMLNKVMIPLARQILKHAYETRILIGDNMTGNTVNSYAVGVYVQGQLVWIETSSQSIPQPLRHKLGRGEIFRKGQIRWDGSEQMADFVGKVSNNGTTEAERSIAFLHEYNASPKGWVICVCNGVEYAVFQEEQYDIDTLTGSYLDTEMYAPRFHLFSELQG